MKPSILFLLCVWLGSWGRAGTDLAVGLPRSTPEAQGISSVALGEVITAFEQEIDAVHSVMIVRHGHVVAEGWWAPYAASEPHEMFSLSKSFTSIAVGIAAAEGRLSLDDPVLKFFPEEAPASPSEHLKGMRIRDLLRMVTGHGAADIEAFAFGSPENLVKQFLALPVPDKPGTHFIYNSGATYLLSAIVQKTSGETVRDYLRPRLFAPLGIADPVWAASAQGISFGGFGLNLRTEDIARFGQLLLQRGEWHGRRLVSAEFVAAATSRQTSNGSAPESDWDQGYGYQFWMCRHGFYRGDGAFGQFCIVMPQHDTVVAITSGTPDMGAVMRIVWDRLVPELRPRPLPAEADVSARLAARLAALALAGPKGSASAPVAAKIAGRKFTFPSNPMGLETVSLQPAGDGTVVFTVGLHGSDQQFTSGYGTWARGSLVVDPAHPGPVAALGAWTADDTYTFKLCAAHSAFSVTVRLRFFGDDVSLDAELTLPTPTKLPTLTGHVG